MEEEKRVGVDEGGEQDEKGVEVEGKVDIEMVRMETRRSRMEQTRLQAPRGTWSSRPPLELGMVCTWRRD